MAVCASLSRSARFETEVTSTWVSSSMDKLSKSVSIAARAGCVRVPLRIAIPAHRVNMIRRRCVDILALAPVTNAPRSEEHTSELQSLMRISYAVFCLKKKKQINNTLTKDHH